MSRAPLAGRPPFATDEPDTIYETSPAPQRRNRQPAPPNPNNKTSAYDMYNNYLGTDAQDGGNRASGVGALGMGLLNMNDDSDSDDEDSDIAHHLSGTNSSKHAALAAATARNNNARPLVVPAKTLSPPHAPKPIAAPKPGYAATVAALNVPASPSPPHSQRPNPQMNRRLPAALQVSVPKPSHPTLISPGSNPFSDPSPSLVSSTPHPLQPPITPIMPVFARPTKSPANISFATTSPSPRPIIRGNSEETLLPARGEKGDDFWRRFSMVAKLPETTKDSPWLKKTQNGDSRLSRWVWVIGISLLVCIGAGVGLGWYFTHNNPAHQRPASLGPTGNATEAIPSSSAVMLTTSGSSTVLKVTPTRTIDKRAEATPAPVGIHVSHKRRGRRTNL